MRVAFIGGGNMATAVIGGLIAHGRSPGDLVVVDPNPAQCKTLSEKFGVKAIAAVDDSVRAANVVLLAVKPQQMREAATSLLPLKQETVVITIAAGIQLSDLSRWLAGHAQLVRAMPNTPALIHQGITGLYAPDAVTKAAREVADGLLRAVGETLWLEREELLDAVTAVSGSGPAYVFYVIEALQDAALSLGFTSEQARALALRTFTGASALAAQSDESPAVLRQRVTSKGGTTERALSILEAAGVKRQFVTAIQAAEARSRELGVELGQTEVKKP